MLATLVLRPCLIRISLRITILMSIVITPQRVTLLVYDGLHAPPSLWLLGGGMSIVGNLPFFGASTTKYSCKIAGSAFVTQYFHLYSNKVKINYSC